MKFEKLLSSTTLTLFVVFAFVRAGTVERSYFSGSTTSEYLWISILVNVCISSIQIYHFVRVQRAFSGAVAMRVSKLDVSWYILLSSQRAIYLVPGIQTLTRFTY